MKSIITTAAVLFVAVTLMPAAPPQVLASGQQAKMKACNEEAGKKDLQGEEQEKFISDCLAAKPAEPEKKLTAQQEKMRGCNREAREKNLKGDDRRKFMSGCLKG